MIKTLKATVVAWLAGALLATAGTEKVDVEKAAKLLGDGNDKVQLLDVRTEKEWNEGHLEEAVRVDFLEDGFAEGVQKELEKDKPVLVYCRSGNRSARAAKVLEELGFKTVYDMKGGITDWKKAGKKVVK